MGILGMNIDWNSVDFETAGLQDRIIRNPKEAGNLFAAWLNNGCRLVIKGPSILVIDRTKPFDPVKFIHSGVSIVEEDERSLALTEIDFAGVRFESGLVGDEPTIDGEEKLKRLKQLTEIRLDAKIGQTLLEEAGQPTLRFLHYHFGVSWLELTGTVLCNSDGYRSFLYVRRDDRGSWSWYCDWLGYGRGRERVSPLLASSPSASTSPT
jgi:hypothetical protein